MGILDKLFGKHKPKYETLGNTEPVCPYCAKPLLKMPRRKTKCPFCANYMYVRTRPADKKRVVVTEQDAARINEQWMVESGTVVGQSSRTYEGPPAREAIEYAKTLHSDLLKDYDEGTRKRVAQIISDGIKSKRGLNGISVDIRREFPAVDKALADNLVHTETSIALSQASLLRSSAMGVTGKEWVCVPDSCEICAKNASVGVIPIDQPFPSGHMTTPAHDGCRCALAPAMLPKRVR